jgi:hypothetical protein
MSEEPRDPTCRHCDAAMEEGFLLDNSFGQRLPVEWVDGPPQFTWAENVKIGDRPRYLVQAFRCTRCGGLDLVAILRRV